MVMLNAQNAQSENDFSGRERPEPGKYHAVVTHAEEKPSKKKATPGLEIEFQILAGDTKGQEGKSIPLFLSYIGGDDAKTKTCLDRVTRLAICTGVLKPGEAKEPNWDEAIGRELVIEIESQEYPDKDGQMKSGSSVSFMGFWSLGNEQVASVPRDNDSPGMRHLKAIGGNGNTGNGTQAQPQQQTQPQTQATAQQPAQTARKNPYADL